MNEPKQSRLHELFVFDAEAGVLIWRERPADDFATARASNTWNTRYAGTVAGGFGGDGYRQISIDGRRWQAHRLIWIFANGPIPAGIQIDHINGDRSDNRLANLRIVTPSENQRNQSMPRNNTSGVVGVSRDKRSRKWLAHIMVARRQKHIGLFETLEAAAAARAKAERELGFHANHGKHPIATSKSTPSPATAQIDARTQQ